MGSKAAPSSFGRLAPTLLPEGHCCPFSSPAGACPGTGQSLPWGPLVACCPRETPRACEMSSGSRANQWVACRRQGRGQGGLSSTPGPRTVSLGRWGPSDGLQGCTPRGGPTLGSSAAIPSLDRPAASWMTQVLPTGLDVLRQVQPPLPPLSCLSTPGGGQASSFPLRWQGGCHRRSPSQALPHSRLESSSVGDPSWPSSTPTGICLRESGNLEGRRPHFTSSLSLTSALPLGQPRRPYFRRGDRSL